MIDIKTKALNVVNTALAKVQNQISNMGVGGGIGFTGFPFNQGSAWTTPVNKTDALFFNLRWYLISNDRQLLNELFAECGLIQTICMVPVQDALRGGIEIVSEELGNDKIKLLLKSMDRDNDLGTAAYAEIWKRLFGGAGILVFTDQDPLKPLNVSKIGRDTPLEFRAADMWELFWDKQNSEGYDPSTSSYDFDYYSYYAEYVHKSRVMKLKGPDAPSFLRPRLRGWGMSACEPLVSSLSQYYKNINVGYEVMDEFKVDVYKIKNLTNTLMTEKGRNQVQDRIQRANFLKNYLNALVMDSEDEWDHKQLNFAGLSDMMTNIRTQVAADMRIPQNKLFGQAATGFSSGEDTLEIYNAMVESEVRGTIKYHILRMAEIKCQKMFGFIPEDLEISFKPLRVMTAEQEENVKDKKFKRNFDTWRAGGMTTEQFVDNCNAGKIFDVAIDAPPSGRGGYLDDQVTAEGQDPYKTTDIDNPGADRADTEKPKATSEGGVSKDPTPPKTKQKNSAAFDKASYEAAGGDGLFDMRRKYFYENPVDRGLWTRAIERTREIYKGAHLPFTVWFYEKQGGTFWEKS